MKKTNFAQVLEAAGSLPIDAQEELVEILHKRTIAERRDELAKDIRKARVEYKRNKCKAVTSVEIMSEILS